mmetsp:Transcript_12210/g.28746  ORF Transcript_12210/g.28746 Transcript_12210/m.28746 type:complete len:239 (-) Transcript_12210:101-817(-)
MEPMSLYLGTISRGGRWSLGGGVRSTNLPALPLSAISSIEGELTPHVRAFVIFSPTQGELTTPSQPSMPSTPRGELFDELRWNRGFSSLCLSDLTTDGDCKASDFSLPSSSLGTGLHAARMNVSKYASSTFPVFSPSTWASRAIDTTSEVKRLTKELVILIEAAVSPSVPMVSPAVPSPIVPVPTVPVSPVRPVPFDSILFPKEGSPLEAEPTVASSSPLWIIALVTSLVSTVTLMSG